MELLAPVGNEKNFFAAVNHGADAVYLGMDDFSARKNAGNFNAENIAYYIAYAHVFGVKVYVAVNTLVKNTESDAFMQTVRTAYLAGADAFIIQDVFLGKILKQAFPDITLHLSTQAGVNNAYGAVYAKEHGFSRVILARETSENEIREISGIIETEIFVHGAMCTCFSGHCYMSSFIGGNSGNRGFCKQPCRKAYTLAGKNGGKYAISLSDLNLSENISKIKELGVKSVKIEGRMRTPEYTACAVDLYRKAIDGKAVDNRDISRVYNRGDYTKGYLFGIDGNIVSDKIQSHKGSFVGKVEKVTKNAIIVGGKVDFYVGDSFKIVNSEGYETGNAVCERKGNSLAYKGKATVGDSVNITKDVRLNNRLLSVEKKRPLNVSVNIKVGKKLELSCENTKIYSDEAVAEAINNETTAEEIKENLSRVDKYPFTIIPEINIEGKPFIPKSVFNKLRAKLYAELFYGKIDRRVAEYRKPVFTAGRLPYNGIVISDSPVETEDGVAFVYAPADYTAESVGYITSLVKGPKFLFVPSFLSSAETAAVGDLLYGFDGVYADGFSGIMLGRKFGKKIIYGDGLNVFNDIDCAFAFSEGADCVVYSKELSYTELDGMKNRQYSFNRGSIRLMELLYCPYGRDCADCKRRDFYDLTDEMGHKFAVRRYKICGKCRFEIYNEQLLCGKNDPTAYVYNLVGLTEEQKKIVLRGSVADVVANFKTTSGNLKRGVN